MNAILVENGVLRYQQVRSPRLGPAELLVKVQAAGVNPLDLAAARRLAATRILGQEVAGTVVEVGARVTGFAVGDAVCAMTEGAALGAYAEYVAVPARATALIPEGLSFADAASLPVAGLAAWQALCDYGQLRAGQRVLIHGAAGCVGCVAVQLALSRGAEVFGTTLAPNVAFVESLGAHRALDQQLTRFEAVVPEVDMVLDTLGGEFLARSYAVLRPGGLLVSTAEPPDAAALATYQLRGHYCQPHPDGAVLARVLDLVASQVLHTKIAAVLPLREAAAALALANEPDTRGKVILQVAEISRSLPALRLPDQLVSQPKP